MAVLHICSDFARQNIYCHLLAALAARGLSQVAFAPVRTEGEVGLGPELEHRSRSPVVLRKVLTPLDRILFRRKIRRVMHTLEAAVNLGHIHLVHAHFWYSDGAVARKLRERYGLPFVVAVRNTDVNAFLRLRPDLLGLATEVLLAAARIVFITPCYVERVLSKLGKQARLQVEGKICVVPNGVAAFWLEGDLALPPEAATVPPETLRVLYVGDFSSNKNLKNLVKAVEILNRSRPVRLTLIGSGGAYEGWVGTRAGAEDGLVTWKGRLSDTAALRREYLQHHVFAMPSLRETFGVVYLEALSQGLPILHSRGEGIDGYFDGLDIAEKANPNSPQEIAEKLRILSERTPGVRVRCRQAARRFDWNVVAAQYQEIYDAAILKGNQRG